MHKTLARKICQLKINSGEQMVALEFNRKNLSDSKVEYNSVRAAN